MHTCDCYTMARVVVVVISLDYLSHPRWIIALVPLATLDYSPSANADDTPGKACTRRWVATNRSKTDHHIRSRQNMPSGPKHLRAVDSTRVTAQETILGTQGEFWPIGIKDELCTRQLRRWHASSYVRTTYAKAPDNRLTR